MHSNLKKYAYCCGALLLLGASVPSALAAQAEATVPAWHAQTLAQALLNVVLFALVGIALAIIGYKAFDLCTPGDLHKEILENKNVAAAIVAASVIVGACIIIAASMLG